MSRKRSTTGVTSPPDVLRWSPRSAGHGDCAVAALELACGVTYETALAAAITVFPEVLQEGLYISHIKQAAGFLGWKARWTRKGFDLDEDSGILSVFQPHVKLSAHVVYLWEGRILEPANGRRGLWLSPHEFISHYQYQVEGLIMLKREDA